MTFYFPRDHYCLWEEVERTISEHRKAHQQPREHTEEATSPAQEGPRRLFRGRKWAVMHPDKPLAGHDSERTKEEGWDVVTSLKVSENRDALRPGDFVLVGSLMHEHTLDALDALPRGSGETGDGSYWVLMAFNPWLTALHIRAHKFEEIYVFKGYLEVFGNKTSHPIAVLRYRPSRTVAQHFRANCIPLHSVSIDGIEPRLYRKRLRTCRSLAARQIEGGSRQRHQVKKARTNWTEAQFTSGTGAQEVLTPDHILETIREVHGPFFDPCPPGATQDALEMDWQPENYVNPPYNCVLAFVEKAVEQALQRGCKTTFLIIAKCNALHYCRMLNEPGIDVHVTFIRGGVAFKNYTHSLPHPLALVRIQPGSGRTSAGFLDFRRRNPTSLTGAKAVSLEICQTYTVPEHFAPLQGSSASETTTTTTTEEATEVATADTEASTAK